MVVYKIRRKTDGAFSQGGTYPTFSKVGKIWKMKGHLTNHLNQVSSQAQYEDCEIVSYELLETEIDSIPLQVYLQERTNLRLAREAERQASRDRAYKELRRRQYEELRKEFE